MNNAASSFRVDLKLHSFHCGSVELTKNLGVSPYASIQEGQDMGSIQAGRSSWFAVFRQGNGNEEFGQALEDFLLLLEQRQSFIEPLLAKGGEMEVVLSQSVAWDDGIIFSLELNPFFLRTCGTYGIGLKVEAWSADKPIRSYAVEVFRK